MKKILFSATVAAMLATGCAKDDAVVGETGGKTITITASRASDSRVAVDDSNAILWQTEDALGVYLGDASSNKRFSLKSGAGSTAAAFECANTTLPTAPSNVYAYYPHAAADVPAASAVPFNLTSQSYGSFGEYWLMAGIAENIGFPTETTFAMQMHNLLSALRVKITNRNATDLTVTQLEIYTATAGDRTFVAAGTIDITSADFTITPTSYTHKVSLDLGEGVTVASGETQILPIVVAPTESLNGKKFYIKYKFKEDAEASVDTKEGKSIARNKFIDIPLTIGTVTITVPETVATVDEANAALENGATDVVITEAPTADQTLVIPHNYSDTEAAVSVKLPAIPDGVALTMSYGDATANAPKTIAVKTADNATVGNLVIDAPESTVTVDGGRFGDPDADTENENMTHRGAALRTYIGSVTTVNGGSFTAGDNYYPWGNGTGYTYAIRNGGEMTINDATLYGAMNGGISCDYSTSYGAQGILYINGGNFTVKGAATWWVLVTASNTEIHVSGGTFTSLNSRNGGLLGGFSGMPSWDATDNLENNGYYITGGTFVKDGETVTF